MELILKFRGIDDFNQPIFKSEKGSYYGTNDILFGYDTTAEQVIKEIDDKKIRLVYFGSSFNCEPMGTRLKSELKIILTK